MVRSSPALLVALFALQGAQSPAARGREAALSSERVRPNDNREPAGTVKDGALVLRLEARMAVWHPEGDDRPGTPMQAFAEEGGPAQIPGPMVRVRAGTEIDVTVRNTLRDTLLVHGLHARAVAESQNTAPVAIAPGERRAVRFRLDAPGTYFYWGTTTRRAINFRTRDDSQLTGAIVVDDPAAAPPRDRVIVIGLWADTVHRALTHRKRLLAVLNGRSWPHTEPLRHTVGDTVRWRVINGTADLHPMHLHGFYFRVDSRGDIRRDTIYSDAARTVAVTESMHPGGTMALTWIPERAGNWLFHCHVPEHIAPRGALGTDRPAAPAVHGPSLHDDHARGGMGGMVMGVHVLPARGEPQLDVSAKDERRIRLLVRQNIGSSNETPFYGYSLHEGGAEPPVDTGLAPAPTLDVVRGQPVRITVVNRLPEPTAVHWHGIELESYFDGVPGFSGAGRRVTPLIAPGDSFIVRFTPPRAGTFIYHTHAEEMRQQLAGLAGPLVVSEPGNPRDPAVDLPILISAPTDVSRHGRAALINGSEAPAPVAMTVGTTYRLRLIQMSVSRSFLHAQLLRDSTHASWHVVAKDGAELPAPYRTARPARTALGIGETYDVEITPDRQGPMRLEIRMGPLWPAPSTLMGTLPIVVRAPESHTPR